VIHAVSQSYKFQRLSRHHRITRDFRDGGDVLGRGETRNQIVKLKDEADVLTAILSELFVIGFREIEFTITYGAGGGSIESSQDVE
jgi:hypothetical protein